MKIPIINPTTALTEKTWLTADYTSGTSLSVKSSNGYADNDLILVGQPGQELSEITDLTATPPSTILLTATALDYAHGKDTPVFKVLYDQAEIYRSTDAGQNYSLLTTISLSYDKLITVYDYVSGSSTDYFKIRLKNSITANVSDYSDPQLGTGWPRKSVGRMIRNVRRGLKDLEDRKYKDWEIMEELKNAADEVNSEIPNAYWSLRSSARTTTLATSKYYLPLDYRAMLFLMYTYNPNASEEKRYPLHYKPKSEFINATSDQLQDDSDYLSEWTEVPGDDTYPNGYFEVHPRPATSNQDFLLWYFREEPSFESYGDITSCPLPQIYESYAIANLTDDDSVRAKHEGLYSRGIRQLKQRQRREFSPKNLIRSFGRDAVSNLYGRGSGTRTQQDIIDYW